MCACTDLWEPWAGNRPGRPGLEGHQGPLEGSLGISVGTVQEEDQPRFDWKWGTVTFFHPDCEYVNRCAYFDYQRQRVYVRTNKSIRRKVRSKRTKGNLHLRITRHVSIMKSKCPVCKKSAIRPISARERRTDCQVPRTKRAYNLDFI
jgi:hypothetical protein